MQSLLAIAAACVLCYAFLWAKNNRYNVIAFLRTFVKRAALFVMSFSWIMVLAAFLILACYSNISELLKEVLSANAVSNVKGMLHLMFGVDSAFAAMQMLALYSLVASFVSCLALTVGLIIYNVYKTILKVERSAYADDGQDFAECSQHARPAFKLYTKFNS